MRSAGRFLAPGALMALLWFLSAQPDLGTGLENWDLLLRKLGHLAVYALLFAAWIHALGPRRALAAFALTVAYAVVDEAHQSTVEGRHGAPLDVLIDSAGAALAWAVLNRRSRLRPAARA